MILNTRDGQLVVVAELYCAQDEVVVYGGYIDDGSTTGTRT